MSRILWYYFMLVFTLWTYFSLFYWSVFITLPFKVASGVLKGAYEIKLLSRKLLKKTDAASVTSPSGFSWSSERAALLLPSWHCTVWLRPLILNHPKMGIMPRPQSYRTLLFTRLLSSLTHFQSHPQVAIQGTAFFWPLTCVHLSTSSACCCFYVFLDIVILQYLHTRHWKYFKTVVHNVIHAS